MNSWLRFRDLNVKKSATSAATESNKAPQTQQRNATMPSGSALEGLVEKAREFLHAPSERTLPNALQVRARFAAEAPSARVPLWLASGRAVRVPFLVDVVCDVPTGTLFQWRVRRQPQRPNASAEPLVAVANADADADADADVGAGVIAVAEPGTGAGAEAQGAAAIAMPQEGKWAPVTADWITVPQGKDAPHPVTLLQAPPDAKNDKRSVSVGAVLFAVAASIDKAKKGGKDLVREALDTVGDSWPPRSSDWFVNSEGYVHLGSIAAGEGEGASFADLPLRISAIKKLDALRFKHDMLAKHWPAIAKALLPLLDNVAHRLVSRLVAKPAVKLVAKPVVKPAVRAQATLATAFLAAKAMPRGRASPAANMRPAAIAAASALRNDSPMTTRSAASKRSEQSAISARSLRSARIAQPIRSGQSVRTARSAVSGGSGVSGGGSFASKPTVRQRLVHAVQVLSAAGSAAGSSHAAPSERIPTREEFAAMEWLPLVPECPYMDRGSEVPGVACTRGGGAAKTGPRIPSLPSLQGVLVSKTGGWIRDDFAGPTGRVARSPKGAVAHAFAPQLLTRGVLSRKAFATTIVETPVVLLRGSAFDVADLVAYSWSFDTHPDPLDTVNRYVPVFLSPSKFALADSTVPTRTNPCTDADRIAWMSLSKKATLVRTGAGHGASAAARAATAALEHLLQPIAPVPFPSSPAPGAPAVAIQGSAPPSPASSAMGSGSVAASDTSRVAVAVTAAAARTAAGTKRKRKEPKSQTRRTSELFPLHAEPLLSTAFTSPLEHALSASHPPTAVT